MNNASTDFESLWVKEINGRLSLYKIVQKHKGQIPTPWYLNYYHCSVCGKEWRDDWDSTCNCKCPDCYAEIEPYRSEQLYTGEQLSG